jgi:hypothetical protein
MYFDEKSLTHEDKWVARVLMELDLSKGLLPYMEICWNEHQFV